MAGDLESAPPDLPLLVQVPVDNCGNAGRIDTELYCFNATDRTFRFWAKSASSSTPREGGAPVVEPSLPPVSSRLAPGQAVQVGNVVGGSGAVSMEIHYVEDGSFEGSSVSYDMRRPSGRSFLLPTIGKAGEIVGGRVSWVGAAPDAPPPETPARPTLARRLWRWLRRPN